MGKGFGGERLEGAVLWAKEKPATAIIIAALAVLVIVFWQAFLFTAVVLAIILGVILIAVKIYYRGPSLKELMREKRQLLHEIRIAERRYMRRKLSEKDFNHFFKEKQRQLIELEALIDQQYNKEKGEEVTSELLAVQAKKRHILRELLAKKKRVVKALGISERRYLKRKIDVKTYKAIIGKKQAELIELEAQIKLLYSEANIIKVMGRLKSRLADFEHKKKQGKKKRQKSERERELEIAGEIAEQVSSL